jgi:hypothetical protein
LEQFTTKASIKAAAQFLGDVNCFKELIPGVEVIKKLEYHGPGSLTFYIKTGTPVLLENF